MISPEELATLIGGDNYDAAKVEELERGAVAYIETQTGRYFGPPDLVEEFVTGNGAGRLWLRDHVTTTYEEGDPPVVTVLERLYPGGDATALVQGTDYELRQVDRESYLVRLDGNAWTGGSEFGVTYWRGYAEDEIPADIRDLVLALVRFRWADQLAGRMGLKSETIGGYSYTRFGSDDLEAVSGWDTLRAWKRPVVA